MVRSILPRWFWWWALAAVTGCGSVPPPQADAPATVTQVVDGDTIEVDIGDTNERVRLLGVDAPESVHPELPVQCFGVEASKALADLVPAGTPVRLERDVEARDRYGRLLLHVHRIDDDLHLNRWLIEQGYADTAVYSPNRAYWAELDRARAEARRNRSGLWGACDGPDQPAD